MTAALDRRGQGRDPRRFDARGRTRLDRSCACRRRWTTRRPPTSRTKRRTSSPVTELARFLYCPPSCGPAQRPTAPLWTGTDRHPTRHGGPCARHPRSGERPARRRLHLDGDHLPLGDLRHLADGARLRLLPRPRGPRRLRGHREDEGDRSRDPGRRERLSVASVPNGRHLPRDPHGHPVLPAARPGERGALGAVDQARPLARVHPGRGVQRHDRLCRDVARGPGERPDGERRP